MRSGPSPWTFGENNFLNHFFIRTLNCGFWRFLKQYIGKGLKTRTLHFPFWIYLKRHSWRCKEILNVMWQTRAFWRYFGSWNCWESFKSRTIEGAFWRYLERCSWIGYAEKNFKQGGCKLVHSNALGNDIWKLDLHRKVWKQGSKLMQSDAIWTMVWKLEMLRKVWKQGSKLMHSDAIWTMVWKLEMLRKCWKQV